MTELLRIYDPWEVGPDGRPLDWECCRACEGGGRTGAPGVDWIGRPTCVCCGGHGSLKAAALAECAARQT